MIEEIEIKNFRGIPHLHVEDTKDINIFVGNNSAGKTTVLESIAYAYSNRNLMPVFLGYCRGIQNDDHLCLQSLFRQVEQKHHDILISIKDSDESHKLTLGIKPKTNEDNLVFGGDRGGDNFFDMQIKEAVAEYSRGKYKLRYQYKLATESGIRKGLTQKKIPSKEKASKPRNHWGKGVFHVHARNAISINETAQAITKIQDSESLEAGFIEVIQSFNSKIKKLRNGINDNNSNIIKADFLNGDSLPVTLLGDGFCRFLLMLTGLYGSNSEVLTVDEIDSGIHHTNMTSIWRALIKANELSNKQIFCTTHSEEMLLATLEAFKDHQEKVRIYRIYEKDDQHFAQKYDYELYESTAAAEMSVR